MSMRLCGAAVLSTVLAVAPLRSAVSAQVPELPPGARSQWVVDQPVEVVGWVIFDPTEVADALPSGLRFVTVSELATQGIPWAVAFLATHRDQRSWGISFIELFRADTFTIDGRQPNWGTDGASAVWFARVAPVESSDTTLGQGTPLLVLAFSMPDSAYAAYMRRKGYQASCSAARLALDAGGTWRGTFQLSGASVAVTCTPAGPIGGGPHSRGCRPCFRPRHLPSRTLCASRSLGTASRHAKRRPHGP